jgi:hypothetical protein
MLVSSRTAGERIVTGDELRLLLWSRSGRRFGLGSIYTLRSGSSGSGSNWCQSRCDYGVEFARLPPPQSKTKFWVGLGLAICPFHDAAIEVPC